jgi:hypothetical protein
VKRRAKRDGNHNKLADLFRTLGCSVIDMVDTGIPGWPDTCIGCIGVTHLCEMKNPDTAYGRAGFNGNQTAFNRDWRGEPVEIVSTEDEVIELVRKWRTTG